MGNGHRSGKTNYQMKGREYTNNVREQIFAVLPNFAATISIYINMATIIVNGESQNVDLPITVSQLIARNSVDQPEMVSVQVNEEFLVRESWDETSLKDGDEVDFLYFMGGGHD